MIDLDLFRAHLEWAEARRRFPYEDQVGKTTIGVGRNLEDKGLSEDEIDYLLDNDIAAVLKECESLPYWDDLCMARKMVVADMVFNMGLPRFTGFVMTNRALNSGDFDEAAEEMKDSKWYRQTGRRARKLVRIMKTGEWE